MWMLRFLSLSFSCLYYFYYKLISQLIKEVTVSMHICTDSLVVRSQVLLKMTKLQQEHQQDVRENDPGGAHAGVRC